MYQRCTFITLKLARVSILQTFGSFPSRRRPVKTQSVSLPAPTRPSVGQQQYRDGSIGTLKSGSSVMGHLEGKSGSLGCHHPYTQKQKPSLILLLPPLSSYQLLGSEGWFNLPPVVSAVEQQGSRAVAVTMSWWFDHDFTYCAAFWKVACASGLFSGAVIHSCASPCGYLLPVPFDIVSSGISWYDQWFSY